MVVIKIKDHPELKISTLAFGNCFRNIDLIEDPVEEDLKMIKKGTVVKSSSRERYRVVTSRLIQRPAGTSKKKTKTLQEEISEGEVLFDIEILMEIVN